MRRIESITAYLKDNGLTESQMQFKTGANGGVVPPGRTGLGEPEQDRLGQCRQPPPTPKSSGGLRRAVTAAV